MFKLASMVNSSEVLIIGAGLAGLTAAIHLSKAGRSVTVIEKHEFPRHKVCGEYISNEVLPYLESLGVDCGELAPVQISNTCISSINGRQLSGKLPLGGFGVSRFALDKFLYDKAVLSGCRMVHDSVTEISFNSDLFTIGTTKSGQLTSKIAVGAFGKRSNIDQKLSRNFIAQKSPWLAVKAHYKGNIPSDVVTLHNFDGGYCGVSKVENDIVNICYLANYDTFKKYKHIEDYQQHVLFKNPALKAVFENCEMQFDKPLTISQISFCKKPTVENHVLMTGDAAGLIHPLCGNGMAMAIHSAKLASELILQYFEKNISRDMLEKQYTKAWQHAFSHRMKMGRLLAGLLRRKKLSNLAMNTLTSFPFLFSEIIKSTHGKPISGNS